MAQRGHKEVANLFFTRGEDAHAQLYRDRTTVDIADLSNHPEIDELLREHGGARAEELKAAKESIHDASKYGIIVGVKQHWADGVNMNTKDEIGRTPLHEEAIGGHTKNV